LIKFGTVIYTGRPEDLIVALYRPSMIHIFTSIFTRIIQFFL